MAWLAIAGLVPLYIAVSFLIGLAIIGGNPTPPVTVHETRLGPVEGRSVAVEFRATRHRDCALAVTTQWRQPDGTIVSQANAAKATLLPGETAWLRLPVMAPARLDPGPVEVRSVGEYACDDGRTFVISTDWLEVSLP